MTSNNNKNATVKGTRAPNDLRLTTISQRTKMIDRGTIDKIMNATDIVDVVKEFVTLRKAGVNYKGLCPFHDEKTPSFVVSPAKQLCKCFSCGKGGNAVHFIMEHEQMTYPEALRWLAKKYGIEVHEKEATEEEKKNASLRESMFVLNEWARDYFSSILHNHADGIALGMSYFRKRGFRDDIIKKFQLGFSLQERDAMAKAAIAQGFNPLYLEKTGLCYKSNDGRLIDRYYGRVIFPVHTISGKVVAFGGRILTSDKKVAKYVNSPESEIYSKSHELYGLYFAKHAIVKQNRCFLVEGYTDVISMHQNGIENVVASSGTSLTEGQIHLLHRFTNNITVLYDGDNAGIKASLRGIDMLLAESMNVKVLLLPDGDDPDSFSRKLSAQDFQEYIESHQIDFIKFKTNLLLHDCGDDPIKRAELIQDIVGSISTIPDGIVRQMYAKECATLLGVSEQLIIAEIAKRMRQAQKEKSTKDTQDADSEESSVSELNVPSAISVTSNSDRIKEEEKLIVSAIIRYGHLAMNSSEDSEQNGYNEMEAPTVSVANYIANDLKEDELQLSTPLYEKILQEACLLTEKSDKTSLQYFLTHPDADISQLAASLGEDKYVLSKNQAQDFIPDEKRLNELIPRLLHDFKYAIIKERMNTLLAQLKNPDIINNPDKCMQIMTEYKEYSEIEKQFAQILGERVIAVR